MSMPTPKKYEPLSLETIAMLRRTFPGVQAMVLGITAIDPERGAGVFEDGTTCAWTHFGKRITFWPGDGCLGASASKETEAFDHLMSVNKERG